MLANITISSKNIDKIKMAFLLFKSIYVGSVSLNTNSNIPAPLTCQGICQEKTSAPRQEEAEHRLCCARNQLLHNCKRTGRKASY